MLEFAGIKIPFSTISLPVRLGSPVDEGAARNAWINYSLPLWRRNGMSEAWITNQIESEWNSSKQDIIRRYLEGEFGHPAPPTPERPTVFKCPICGATFSSLVERTRHIASAHPEPPEPPPERMILIAGRFYRIPGKPEIYRYEIPTPYAFIGSLRHVPDLETFEAMGRPTVFEIDQATFDATPKGPPLPSVKEKPPEPPPPPQPLPYRCPICGATFSSLVERTRHIASAHPKPTEPAPERMILIAGRFYRIPGKPEIYRYEIPTPYALIGYLRHVPDLETFEAMGRPTVFEIDQATFDATPKGPPLPSVHEKPPEPPPIPRPGAPTIRQQKCARCGSLLEITSQVLAPKYQKEVICPVCGYNFGFKAVDFKILERKAWPPAPIPIGEEVARNAWINYSLPLWRRNGMTEAWITHQIESEWISSKQDIIRRYLTGEFGTPPEVAPIPGVAPWPQLPTEILIDYPEVAPIPGVAPYPPSWVNELTTEVIQRRVEQGLPEYADIEGYSVEEKMLEAIEEPWELAEVAAPAPPKKSTPYLILGGLVITTLGVYYYKKKKKRGVEAKK